MASSYLHEGSFYRSYSEVVQLNTSTCMYMLLNNWTIAFVLKFILLKVKTLSPFSLPEGTLFLQTAVHLFVVRTDK